MRTISKADTIRLIDSAMDPFEKGATKHLRGSGHGRYIVAGMTPAVRLPMHQAHHPATLSFVTEKVNALLQDFPRAEVVSSRRDIVTGDVYLDLCSTHEKRDTAVYVAGVRGERAIHDSLAGTVEWS